MSQFFLSGALKHQMESIQQILKEKCSSLFGYQDASQQSLFCISNLPIDSVGMKGMREYDLATIMK